MFSPLKWNWFVVIDLERLHWRFQKPPPNYNNTWTNDTVCRGFGGTSTCATIDEITLKMRMIETDRTVGTTC